MDREGFRDKRAFERIPLDISVRFHDRYSNTWGLARTQDLSAQGAGLLMDKKILLNSPLEIWFPIIKRGESFYTRGDVVWSASLNENKYRIGVNLRQPEFAGISEVLKEV